MVGILKDAKDDFSIKDLLNKLREWSFHRRAPVDKLNCGCLAGELMVHALCHGLLHYCIISEWNLQSCRKCAGLL